MGYPELFGCTIDIESCFDNIDKDILMSILNQEISKDIYYYCCYRTITKTTLGITYKSKSIVKEYNSDWYLDEKNIMIIV